MNALRTYIENHKDRFLQELISFLRIPSVGAVSEHAEDMKKAANFVKEQLKKAGADKVYLIPTIGQPLVYGEKIVDATLPTILVYGHYDVQPVDPINLWNAPPFEPKIKNGKIYARGACDDKGQVYAHIKALEAMIATKALDCNVKFLIEGEEETASHGIEHFLKDRANQNIVSADILLVSDTSIIDMDTPSIDTSLRGVAALEITVQGPNRDLHSGVYGGAVMNPAEALAKILSQLKDNKGRILVPGFYDEVEKFSKAEKEDINSQPFNLDHYQKELGIDTVFGEEGYTTLERLGIRPSLEINGIYGGYTGEGIKTVIPAQAKAKISIRTVSNQNSTKLFKKINDHLISIAPPGVRISTEILHSGCKPLRVNKDSKGIEAAKSAFEEVWGKPPILKPQGASIPILSVFQETTSVDVVMLGFGLDSDNIHSPNEHFGIENFIKGIETIVAFYKNYADIHKHE